MAGSEVKDVLDQISYLWMFQVLVMAAFLFGAVKVLLLEQRFEKQEQKHEDARADSPGRFD